MSALPENEEAQLLQQLITTDAGIVKDGFGCPRANSFWFLVSRTWYRQWELYHGLVNREDGDEEQKKPGPVDNSDILLDPAEYYCDLVDLNVNRALKPGLVQDEHYIITPPEAWAFLAKTYGVKKGSIVPRVSIQQSLTRTFIELELREIRLAVVRSDLSQASPKPLFLSRKHTLAQLYKRVFAVLKNWEWAGCDSEDRLALWEFDHRSDFGELVRRIEARRDREAVAFPGGRLPKYEETLDDADLPGLTVIVAEIRSRAGVWPFAQNFVGIRCNACAYERDLNPDNPIGTKCKLVKAYAELMKTMSVSSSSVSPWAFKLALGSVVQQFYGSAQHDSHELLTYVLDLIHEDINRVKSKPSPSEIDQTGLAEAEVASRFWANHQSRNRSFIVDLMHGQYRSEVVCPLCGNVSLSFDPFLTLSVPLVPKQEMSGYDVRFIPYGAQKAVCKLRIRVPARSAAIQLKTVAANFLSRRPECLMLASVFNFSISSIFPDSATVDNQTFLLYEKPEIKQSQELVFLCFAKEPETNYYRKGYFTHPRLLVLDYALSLADVYRRVADFLLEVQGTNSVLTANCQDACNLPSDIDGLHFTLHIVNVPRVPSSILEPWSCSYCGSKDCRSCQLPGDMDTLWRTVSEKNVSATLMRVEVTVQPEDAGKLAALKNEVEHESFRRVSEEEQREQTQELTLQECLQFSSQGETLDANNEVYCSRCKQHVPATKRLSTYRLPKVLIVHLKRFKARRYNREKDERKVTFPVEGFDLREFCPGSRAVYDLYAVSNHYGGMAGGHYTAFAKTNRDGQWFRFDDSVVTETKGTASTLVTSAAYVLFYRARDLSS